MKKIIFALFLFFLILYNVKAEDNIVKVYMFSISNSSYSKEVIEEIKQYDNYNDKFELIVLDSCELNGNGFGNDKYSENQNILDRLIKDYNEYNNEENNSRQYPIFLVGKEVLFGIADLRNVIQKNIEDDKYNDHIFNCVKSNYTDNCFGKKKKNYAIYIIISIFLIIIIIIGLSLKMIF